MALHDGLELVEGDAWTDEAHVNALLAAGLVRFVDGRGAVGNRQMSIVSIGQAAAPPGASRRP